MTVLESTHGNISSYRYGCRCDDCRKASADYQRERRRKARTSGACIDDLYNTLTEIVLDRQAEWRNEAACRHTNTPVDVFFAQRGDTTSVRTAKAVCETCPVTVECRNYMVNNRTKLIGIWGGESAGRARRITAPARTCDNCQQPIININRRDQLFCSTRCRNESRYQ